MDYKYIEELLERYWQCDTSLEEEEILRTFFRQEELPLHLRPYRDLFAYQRAAREVRLGEDFDAALMARIEKPVVKARRIPLQRRLRPLYKAAAVVAIVLCLGDAAQHAFRQEAEPDYNYDSYTDTYSDPQAAYGEISDALMTVSESIQKYGAQPAVADSVKLPAPAEMNQEEEKE